MQDYLRNYIDSWVKEVSDSTDNQEVKATAQDTGTKLKKLTNEASRNMISSLENSLRNAGFDVGKERGEWRDVEATNLKRRTGDLRPDVRPR